MSTCAMDGRLTFRLEGHAVAALERVARRNERTTGAELRRAVKAHLALEDLAHNDDGSLSRASRATTSAVTGDGHGEAYPS